MLTAIPTSSASGLTAALSATAFAALVLGFLFGMACGGDTRATPSPTPTPLANVPASHDDLLFALGQRVPAFGGMYSSGDVLYVLMAADENEASIEEVKEGIQLVFGYTMIADREVRLTPVEYSITQLYEWYTLMQDQVWAIPEVTMTDLQEATNSITIGINDLSKEDQVEETMAALGIPRNVFSIQQTGFARSALPTATIKLATATPVPTPSQPGQFTPLQLQRWSDKLVDDINKNPVRRKLVNDHYVDGIIPIRAVVPPYFRDDILTVLMICPEESVGIETIIRQRLATLNIPQEAVMFGLIPTGWPDIYEFANSRDICTQPMFTSSLIVTVLYLLLPL